jgi:hypothetical protein
MITCEDFSQTKKGQPRKYIRKAYEKSKQLRQKARGRPQLKTNGMQGNYYRYELASLERLESALLGLDYDLPSTATEARWIKCLREMFVYFEKVGK